ncbi:MAG: hypothetical protein H7222_06600 [Methylotenera sp.]|nr:hypothetical protein [Oligoflexia bacterium]
MKITTTRTLNRTLNRIGASLIPALVVTITLGACSHEKTMNRAKETAARYWQDKAYPGKSYDVQVTEATKADDGTYRVKGIVDGETRVGSFNPDTENFSEGYYALSHEKTKHIAELEQESKYWKEKAESLEKENYKLKVRLNMAQGKKTLPGDDGDEDSAAPAKK